MRRGRSDKGGGNVKRQARVEGLPLTSGIKPIYFSRTLPAPDERLSTLFGLPEYMIRLAPLASPSRRLRAKTLTRLAPLAANGCVLGREFFRVDKACTADLGRQVRRFAGDIYL